MAGNKHEPRAHLLWRVGVLLVAGVLLWAYPPFRVDKIAKAGGGSLEPNGKTAFDAAAAAEKLWSKDFPSAVEKASDLLQVARAVQANPAQARSQLGRQDGLGAVYYFVHGTGRIVSREGTRVRVALGETNTLVVEVRLGPIFGNTVRDACGLVNVNGFPGLQEFNALSMELNALVEKQVLPLLREKAVPGAQISFTGCAEAPDTVGVAGAPLLVLVPIKAEVR